MNPSIIDKPAFLVVGMRALWNLKPEIPASLWADKMLSRRKEVPAVPGTENTVFGIFSAIPDSGGKLFDYVAGMMVSSFENIPVGMVGWEVPGGTYVSVATRGLSSIYGAYREIVDKWLPGSGYVLVDSPVFCLSSQISNPADPSAFWQVNVQIKNLKHLTGIEMWNAD